jgi:hypothetical protein
MSFVEFSTKTPAGFIPNWDWLAYYATKPTGLEVITNGTHCATLRGDGEPYLVPTADCANNATLVRQNGTWLQAGGGGSFTNVWACVGAVEPNPLVRASTAAQILTGEPICAQLERWLYSLGAVCVYIYSIKTCPYNTWNHSA